MRENQLLGLVAVLLLEALHLNNRGVISSYSVYIILLFLCVTVLMYKLLNK